MIQSWNCLINTSVWNSLLLFFFFFLLFDLNFLWCPSYSFGLMSCDWSSGFRVQRWFFPYDYQIIQEIYRHEPDQSSRSELLDIRNDLTPDEARSYAISQLPREKSKHTGFAFDSPGYESFFASQQGVYAPQKAWDVARRASMRSGARTAQKKWIKTVCTKFFIYNSENTCRENL